MSETPRPARSDTSRHSTANALRLVPPLHAPTTSQPTSRQKLLPQVLVYPQGAAGRGLWPPTMSMICAAYGCTSDCTKLLSRRLAGSSHSTGDVNWNFPATMPSRPPATVTTNSPPSSRTSRRRGSSVLGQVAGVDQQHGQRQVHPELVDHRHQPAHGVLGNRPRRVDAEHPDADHHGRQEQQPPREARRQQDRPSGEPPAQQQHHHRHGARSGRSARRGRAPTTADRARARR